MKKIFISLIAASMIAACGSKAQPTDAPSESTQDSSAVTSETPEAVKEDNNNEEAARATVEKIYNIYFNPGGSANEGDEESVFGFMTKYVTDDFNKVCSLAQSKQESTGDLWLDCDPWIWAQDSEDLELVSTKVKKFTSGKAEVEVKFKNMGTVYTAGCVMVYDAKKDAWLVDDLISGSNHSLRKMAKDFCS